MRWTVVVSGLSLAFGLSVSGTVTHAQTISVADAAVAEGDAATTPLDFVLTLSAPSALTVTVQVSTQDGTASSSGGGMDYDRIGPGPLLVTFMPGETIRTVSATVHGDVDLEADETLFLDLFNPTNATVANTPATGTIANDDGWISIGDVSLLEGDAGTTAFVFQVTLSTPSPSPVSVVWATADGSATVADSDYVADSGTVTFPALSTLPETITVDVNGDTIDVLDEVFFVDLSLPTGAGLLKAQGVGTILDDDAPFPPVEAFSVVSDSVGAGPTDGRNRLQWVVPAGATGATVVVRYNEAASCSYPATTADGTVLPVPPPVPDQTHVEPHPNLTLDLEYCYRIWLDYGGGNLGGPEEMKARPFDSTGSVKRKYFTGTTTLAAPTVGIDAVIVPSNDTYIHAMQREDPVFLPDAGGWPTNWRPRKLESVVQHRMPVVPLAGGSRAFISTALGWVHAVDTTDGTLLWSTRLPQRPAGAARGAPAGIFTAFGGAYDYILVGTSESSVFNRLYALNPFDGAVIDAFPLAHDPWFNSMGAILGMPSVDYTNRRVVFASNAAGPTVWGLDLGPPSDALRLAWQDGTDDVNSSAVLHKGRVYVGTVGSLGGGNSEIHSLSVIDGSAYSPPLVLPDAEVKGFLFPDRRSSDLYAATEGTADKVWAITDTGTELNHDKWGASEPVLIDPSVVLFHAGTDDIYVGVRDYLGSAAVTPAIVKLSALDGSYVSHVELESVPPATLFSIGPPSLDLGFGVLYVGSEPGIIYAVALAGF